MKHLLKRPHRFDAKIRSLRREAARYEAMSRDAQSKNLISMVRHFGLLADQQIIAANKLEELKKLG